MVFAGSQVRDDAHLTQPCVVCHNVIIENNAWIEGSQLSHGARISDNVTIQLATVRGQCHIFGDARVLHGCEIIAAKGLTPDNEQILRIYDRATLTRSRVVHQAQVYGDAMLHYAFVEHRAEVFDFAILDGNELNDVWMETPRHVTFRWGTLWPIMSLFVLPLFISAFFLILLVSASSLQGCFAFFPCSFFSFFFFILHISPMFFLSRGASFCFNRLPPHFFV